MNGGHTGLLVFPDRSSHVVVAPEACLGVADDGDPGCVGDAARVRGGFGERLEAQVRVTEQGCFNTGAGDVGCLEPLLLDY